MNTYLLSSSLPSLSVWRFKFLRRYWWLVDLLDQSVWVHDNIVLLQTGWKRALSSLSFKFLVRAHRLFELWFALICFLEQLDGTVAINRWFLLTSQRSERFVMRKFLLYILMNASNCSNERLPRLICTIRGLSLQREFSLLIVNELLIYELFHAAHLRRVLHHLFNFLLLCMAHAYCIRVLQVHLV